MDKINWPVCLSEDETLDKLVAGYSISRFGDGEIGIALGGGNSTHAANPVLAKELRNILHNPHPDCIVAIPTMNEESPKHSNWVRHKERWAKILDMDKIYGSVFVGQSVSAPWILNDTYIRKFRSVWRNKKVGLVCHEFSGLNALVKTDNTVAVEIRCPELEAYSQIEELEKQCLDADCEIILIAAGPMATCLAHRLSKNVQAIDLGRGVGVVLRYPL